MAKAKPLPPEKSSKPGLDKVEASQPASAPVDKSSADEHYAKHPKFDKFKNTQGEK